MTESITEVTNEWILKGWVGVFQAKSLAFTSRQRDLQKHAMFWECSEIWYDCFDKEYEVVREDTGQTGQSQSDWRALCTMIDHGYSTWPLLVKCGPQSKL